MLAFCSLTRGINEKILAKYWKYFLRLFQSFLKVYLFKLIQIALFRFFTENLGRRKVRKQNPIRRISELLKALQKQLISPLLKKVRGDVSPKKALAFTAIKSEVRRF